MDLFLKVLEKKVSHRDRWFRFVDAIKNAGMQYRVTSYATYLSYAPYGKKKKMTSIEF